MAECKRKNTIKNGFDFLKALVPSLAQNPNAKISKAALLIKVSLYIVVMNMNLYQIKIMFMTVKTALVHVRAMAGFYLNNNNTVSQGSIDLLVGDKVNG